MAKRRAVSIASRLLGTLILSALVGLASMGWLMIQKYRVTVEDAFDESLEDDVIHLASSLHATGEGEFALATPLETMLYDAKGSGWVWQLATSGGVVAGSGSLNGSVPIGAPSGRYGYFVLPSGFAVRGVERSVEIAGLHEPALLSVARERSTIDDRVAAFAGIVEIAFATFGATLILMIFAQVRFGLRPLRRLSEAIDELRRTGAPLSGTPWPPELVPVVESLEELHAHSEILVDRAGRQAADLAHAIKTPLSVVRVLGDSMPEAARQQLTAQVARMDGALRLNLSKTRAPSRPGQATKLRPVIDDLVYALDPLTRERGIIIDNAVGTTLVNVDRESVIEMFGNLLENAVKFGSRRISVSACVTGDKVLVSIDDDGPGIAPEHIEAAIGRGQRLDETVQGHGFGLSIVDDLSRTAAGRLRLGPSPLGGLSASLELPGRIEP